MVSSNSSWRVMGVSVTGTSHLRIGRGCDDAHGFRLHESDQLLLAAADGAGSAAYSAMGAATAVRSTLDAAELILTGPLQPNQRDQWLSVLTMILQSTHAALHRLASEKIIVSQSSSEKYSPLTGKPTIRDYATTLMVAIITPDWVATVQVGDGAMVVQQDDGSFTSLTPRNQSEYVNETDFVTDSAYLSLADYTVLPRTGIRGIALLTDGLQTVAMKMPENIPYAPFFTPLFRTVARSAGSFGSARTEAIEGALRSFLESERICARTDDDKTLVLAVYQ
jgi:Protein phosphatase 2C